VSIPELGTIKAKQKPLVFLTSNDTRDISDALKRRCLHLYIPFPDAKLEERIVNSQIPDISSQLSHQLVSFVQSLRELDLKKSPAISETIDWAQSLLLLHADSLDQQVVEDTLNVLIKFQQDIELVEAELLALLRKT
jgi:MoxR-like ATPase